MKKFFSLLLILAMLVSVFAACGEEGGGRSENTSDGETTTNTTTRSDNIDTTEGSDKAVTPSETDSEDQADKGFSGDQNEEAVSPSETFAETLAETTAAQTTDAGDETAKVTDDTTEPYTRPEEETTEDPWESVEIVPTTPIVGVDYDGYIFMLLHSHTYDNISYSEDEVGNSIYKQGVLLRNRGIEDTFNVDLQDLIMESAFINEYVAKQALVSESSYDLALIGRNEKVADIISKGAAADLSAMENIDLSQPWYISGADEALQAFGKTYFVTSHFPYLPATAYLYFNKALMEELSLDLPYNAIMNGKWTMEAMRSYISAAHTELDVYGYSGHPTGVKYFFRGMDGTNYESKDGVIKPVILDNDLQRIYSSLQSLRRDSANHFSVSLDMNSENSAYRPFIDGKALFSYLDSGSGDVADLEFEFGVAIAPKYDLNQGDYRCYANGGFVMIPANVADAEKTSYLFEAVSECTYRVVYQAELQELAKFSRFSNEDLKIRMLMDLSLRQDLLNHFDPSGQLADCWFIQYCLNMDADPSQVAPAFKDMIEQSFSRFFDK